MAGAYRTVRRELKLYAEELARKPEILALNKCDALTAAEIKAKRAALARAARKKVILLSGVAGTGVEEALGLLLEAIRASRSAERGAQRPIERELPA